jgi:predicted ABC-type ATPase
MPSLHIIAGPNGAGKSTVGSDYIPDVFKNHVIFDGDKLFMNKRKSLWQEGIKANKESKRLAWEFVEATFDNLVIDRLSERLDFIYEGHFTNEATWDIPRKFKQNGFDIHMVFFGLANVELSELRVIARSREGGHYVDPLTVSANYYGNLEKLNKHFGMFDSLQIIDTSEVNPLVLILMQNGVVTEALQDTLLPGWFKNHLPAIYAKCIKDTEG